MAAPTTGIQFEYFFSRVFFDPVNTILTLFTSSHAYYLVFFPSKSLHICFLFYLSIIICLCIYLCICVSIYLCIYVSVYPCIHLCIHVCMYSSICSFSVFPIRMKNLRKQESFCLSFFNYWVQCCMCINIC